MSMASEVADLKKAPTIEKWHLEISRILQGQRSSVIDRMGSVEGYISRLIEDSADRVRSCSHFNSALRHQVQSWLPSSVDTYEFNVFMASLIREFIPDKGDYKIIQRMVGGGRLPEPPRDGFYLPLRRKGLRAVFLEALAVYYPTMPSRKSRLYLQYCEILAESLNDPEARAIALDSISISGINDLPGIPELVKSQSDVEQLAYSLLCHPLGTRQKSSLRNLHAASLKNKNFSFFLSGASRAGFDYQIGQPSRLFGNKMEISLGKVSRDLIQSAVHGNALYQKAKFENNWPALEAKAYEDKAMITSDLRGVSQGF